MSLKNIDMDSVMRRLADKRIEDAMAEGKFDNLEGAGKPIELEDIPADENARMLWWALRIMRNNNFTPHEVQLAKTDRVAEGRARSRDDRVARGNRSARRSTSWCES